MKIIEVINKIKQMPIGTIIECKKIKAKYELVKDNTGKNKHFRRIKEGKSIPRFTGLIYSDLDFEILEDKTEEIEEYKTNYTERCIDIEVREKLNEVIRAVNTIKKTFTIDTSKETNCMTD